MLHGPGLTQLFSACSTQRCKKKNDAAYVVFAYSAPTSAS